MTRYDQELLGIDVERHEYEHQKKTDLHHVPRLVTAFYTNPDNNCTENVSQLLKSSFPDDFYVTPYRTVTASA